MTRLSNLQRTFHEDAASNLSHSQIELDNALSRFSEEASNPVTLVSMTLGSLAFQGTRSALLAIRGFQNPVLRTAFSYTGALASEVSVFRASNIFLNNSTRTQQAAPLQEIFDPKSWFSTALDFSLLKFTGAATGTQNIFLRHAAQDMAMVTGHELGARLGWANAESGTFIEKLFHAEMINLQLMAGGSLGHVLGGGRVQLFERSLSLQSEVLSHRFRRIEPRWTDPLPTMASTADSTLVPASIRISLEARLSESPHEWATRLIEHVFQKPEINALHAIDRLYARLRNPATHDHAMEAVHQMEELTRKIPEGENLLVRRYEIAGIEKPLLLVSLPTTFLPEAWSKTFVDGLAEEHQGHPQTRKLAIEVGSGTGFVSIAMAKLGMADRIIATDRNHHALLIGRLNATLNGVDNIKFETGNLLNNIPENTQADLIVGCLPQMPSVQASQEIGLRDLADYAEKTGAFEDQLGLGLNAKAIDQARTRLSPRGKLRLMMAQRPGLTLVHDLFATRGFAPRIIHSTFIQQEPTTNFDAMVEIERLTDFRFEFRTPDKQVMSATEALDKPRNEIFHYLHLVEATPYSHLMQRAIDETETHVPHLGYTEDPGLEHPPLREQIRKYLQGNWGAVIEPDTLFLAPSHATLLDAAIRLTVEPHGKIEVVGDLDANSQRVMDQYLEVKAERIDENLRNLSIRLETNSPHVLVLKLSRQILQNPRDLEGVLQVAIRKNIALIFLEEQGAILHSSGRALLKTLSRFPQALAQTVIIHPLDSMFHSPSLPLAAAIISNPKLHERMMHFGDVTYSRASSAVQALYASFFSQPEMEAIFQDPLDSGRIKQESTQNFPTTSVARQLDNSLIFRSSPYTQATRAPLIDMSFGESEWRTSSDLTGDGSAIFRRATTTQADHLYAAAQQAVKSYLEKSREASYTDHEISLGGGVQPLLISAIRAIQKLHPSKEIEVLIPEPSYGVFYPTVIAAGARLVRVPTSSAERFLVTPRALRAFPRTPNTTRVLLINTPTNPVGQYYRPADLLNLAQVTVEQGDYLLVDEVFGLLKIATSTYTKSPGSMDYFHGSAGKRLVSFGGLSKEFALGGLRFGFATSFNMDLIRAMNDQLLYAPDPIALASAATILPRWRSFLPEHIHYLEKRANRLEIFFYQRGIHVHRVEGGYSLFADLGELFNNPHTIQGVRLTPDNFHHLLLKYAGIKIKSDQWAGVPQHYRFVFSIDPLDEAIERLEAFWALIEKP